MVAWKRALMREGAPVWGTPHALRGYRTATDQHADERRDEERDDLQRRSPVPRRPARRHDERVAVLEAEHVERRAVRDRQRELLGIEQRRVAAHERRLVRGGRRGRTAGLRDHVVKRDLARNAHVAGPGHRSEHRDAHQRPRRHRRVPHDFREVREQLVLEFGSEHARERDHANPADVDALAVEHGDRVAHGDRALDAQDDPVPHPEIAVDEPTPHRSSPPRAPLTSHRFAVGGRRRQPVELGGRRLEFLARRVPCGSDRDRRRCRRLRPRRVAGGREERESECGKEEAWIHLGRISRVSGKAPTINALRARGKNFSIVWFGRIESQRSVARL